VASTIVIAFDGVLRADIDASPIRAGLMLYHGSVGIGTVGLIVDKTTKEKADYWLKLNGLKDHSWVVYREPGDPEDLTQLRDLQVSRLRTLGAAVDLVIEPNPLLAAHMQKMGLTVVLFMHPNHGRPEWRADYSGPKPRAWDEIMEDVTRTQLEKAAT
jgi:hypothetical protein